MARILFWAGNDTITGDADDDLIGGHNVVGGHDGNDRIDGGTGNDIIAGDNASLLRNNTVISPRIALLSNTVIYDSNGNPLLTAAPQVNPRGAKERTVMLFDHSDTPLANTWGNDYIAGGAQDDVIFGELGDDTIQGDGTIGGAQVSAMVDANGLLTVQPSAEAASDGDDYIEGNGGDDLIFGNLGQDDIIGGSSCLYSLALAAQRPDGADRIFGGAGTDIVRNHAGDANGSGHALDADVILGDNGNIFRLVKVNGTTVFLTFNYDNYPADSNPATYDRVMPRVQWLDYTPGPGAATDRGTDDELHGESDDDVIHGMTGNDMLFGEGQDDDLCGGTGYDRIYGGRGEDGIIGDDGRMATSRNGFIEPLYGITVAAQQNSIGLQGPYTGAVVDITGRIKKSPDLFAFDFGGNDILYGGLGDDFIHGVAGDDAISGAEAVAAFYNSRPQTNSNPLQYNPVTTKFAAYDADNPRTKIAGFLLNFDAASEGGAKINDGKDHLFGDLGNDWIVGGTMNDRLFGGLGDDLLNADDNLENGTAPGLNNRPDAAPFADADFAFGGGGRDVLIANTGADRLLDWTSEFNSYIVPFSPFGSPTIERFHSPDLEEFVRALGAASGADLGLTEPNGELGVSTDGQTGGPRDPQPGTIPGVQQDTQGGKEDDTNNAGTKTLLASAAPNPDAEVADRLTPADLAPIFDEAVARWRTSRQLDANAQQLLLQVDIRITDLPDLTLGMVDGMTVLIDASAAGWGWYIDTTPKQDQEFRRMPDGSLLTKARSDANGRMDLLTVVSHEIGHILGYTHTPSDDGHVELMDDRLAAGVRELPASSTGVSYFDTSAGLFVKDENQHLPITASAQDEFLVVMDQYSKKPRHELYKLITADDKRDTSVVPVILPDETESLVTRLKRLAARMNWK